jgi:uncharacterized protein (DUF2249 family)
MMIINSTTRIGTVIKSNPLAIETLISLSPHFSKLKNPVLRKLLAPWVTIAEAAVIGKCSAGQILDRLALIGFEVNRAMLAPDVEDGPIDKGKIELVISHDARPELDAGLDPLNSILEKLSGIEADQTMLVINSFEPVPLIRILKDKGYRIAISGKFPGLVCTYITKTNTTQPGIERGSALQEEEKLFENILRHYNLKFTEVDVREMEAPGPMVTILDELEQLQNEEALYVRHRKIPVYLLPKLKERHFNYVFQRMNSDLIMLIYPDHICA